MTSRIALRTTGLGKNYGPVRALSNVTLDVVAGSVLALLGENGAGKSTFISLVSGATRPTSGSIQVNGEPVTFTTPRDAARRGIVVVHQEPKLANEASVAENIFLARYAEQRAYRLVRPSRMAAEARKHLADLGLLDSLPRVSTPANGLSAAQRQLLAIAKAMSSPVDVLFLDEPNSSLTPRETTQLWDLVRALRDRGVAVVVVSHRLSELYQVVDRVAVLRDGELVGGGTAAEIPLASAVALMAGRKASARDAVPSKAHTRGDEVIRLHNVRTRSIHGVNLVVHGGEVLGLAGLIGSGRTELGRAICGADLVLSGTVTLAGRRATFHSPRDGLAAGVVMTSEERRLAAFVSQDVGFNIAASSFPRIGRFGFLTRKMERALARKWVDKLALRGGPATPITALSGGNQQKALISRALAVKPRLVVFDEPTHGIDVGTKAEIANHIRELSAQGVGIILISSEVEELVGIADRVAVMRHGQIVQEATGADGISLVAAALGETIPATAQESMEGRK